MQFRVKASGHSYQVEVAGEGEPLLLLHGFTGDRSAWAELSQQLRDDFELIALDLLGHGGSDAPADPVSYRMERAAADIADLLNQLGGPRPHLLGYSMGGRLALFLALRFPHLFKSLTLESASPGLAGVADRAERRRQDDDLAHNIEIARH